ncbi:hypothetical protein VCSRO206_3340 [Vibrio cholerae]|nr:hypothetical protein [Vibrio cholerae]GHX28977.1 hypothetical protein VCSRO204_2792 [Vibrio cholerae]GHX59363.1 hypothetical protein VCSRO206_3340 [Vibrio cholerae]
MRLGLLESVTQLNSHALRHLPTFLFLEGRICYEYASNKKKRLKRFFFIILIKLSLAQSSITFYGNTQQ